MKTIKFPTEVAQDSKTLLKVVVSNHKEGFTIDQVRVGIKILDKIEAAEDEVVLEDAEYAFAVQQINSTKWKIISQDIIDFVDTVTNAK